MFDESDTLSGIEPSESQPPEEKGNRTFLIVGGIFAGLILITIVCMAVYLLLIRPGMASRDATQSAQQTAVQAGSETQVAEQTLTADASLWTKTPQPTPMPTNTPRSVTQAMPSAVINLATPSETATTDPATMAAMQTQLSGQMTQTSAAQGTRAVGGEGPLPTTGFADEVGLPLLILLTFALLAVIFVARRMRKTPSR